MTGRAGTSAAHGDSEPGREENPRNRIQFLAHRNAVGTRTVMQNLLKRQNVFIDKGRSDVLLQLWAQTVVKGDSSCAQYRESEKTACTRSAPSPDVLSVINVLLIGFEESQVSDVRSSLGSAFHVQAEACSEQDWASMMASICGKNPKLSNECPRGSEPSACNMETGKESTNSSQATSSTQSADSNSKSSYNSATSEEDSNQGQQEENKTPHVWPLLPFRNRASIAG